MQHLVFKINWKIIEKQAVKRRKKVKRNSFHIDHCVYWKGGRKGAEKTRGDWRKRKDSKKRDENIDEKNGRKTLKEREKEKEKTKDQRVI